MPEHQTITLHDMIRGEVTFDSSQSDDKVLLKADGMPTYHLAVVVDDYLMKITHAFRGEEWLPSAPVHVLLWEYLGWKAHMPQWAHLPLILKPDGNGKLSKRDGDRLGFPVFAMNWLDPKTGEITKGFKEMGFLPEAFINMLAMLGWNSGSEQEVFSLDELVQKFSIERVHKGGAKFEDLAKASKDPGSAEQGGDLGWAPSDPFVKPFSDAMMTLKAGDITQTPVKTQFGFHVIKLEGMRDAQLPPFEEVKPQIAESLQQRKLQSFQQDLKKKAKIQ